MVFCSPLVACTQVRGDALRYLRGTGIASNSFFLLSSSNNKGSKRHQILHRGGYRLFTARTTLSSSHTNNTDATTITTTTSFFRTLQTHDPQSLAVKHSKSGRSFTYGDLSRDITRSRKRLLQRCGSSSLSGQRVAFLAENSYDYVGTYSFLSLSASIKENTPC